MSLDGVIKYLEKTDRKDTLMGMMAMVSPAFEMFGSMIYEKEENQLHLRLNLHVETHIRK